MPALMTVTTLGATSPTPTIRLFTFSSMLRLRSQDIRINKGRSYNTREETRSNRANTSSREGTLALARIWSRTRVRSGLIAIRVRIMKKLSRGVRSSAVDLPTGNNKLNYVLREAILPRKSDILISCCLRLTILDTIEYKRWISLYKAIWPGTIHQHKFCIFYK